MSPISFRLDLSISLLYSFVSKCLCLLQTILTLYLYFYIKRIPMAKTTLCMTFITDLDQLPKAFLKALACNILFCVRFCALFNLNILEGWLIVVISVGGHCSPGQC